MKISNSIQTPIQYPSPIPFKTLSPSPHIRSLGVIFDSTLFFNQHVTQLTRTAFFHLKNIACLHPSVERRLQASSGRQLALRCCTHVTRHMPHSPLLPFMHSQFGGLFKLQGTPNSSSACRCCCCPPSVPLHLLSAPPPPQHPAAGSEWGFSMFWSSLLYIYVNLSAGSDEVGAWTPDSNYVLLLQ